MKAQATMEYLIIIAIVLFITASAIFLVTNTSDTNIEGQSQRITEQDRLGIVTTQKDARGFVLELANGLVEPVTLTSITVDGAQQFTDQLPRTILGQERLYLIEPSLYGNATQQYDHVVEWNYTHKQQNTSHQEDFFFTAQQIDTSFLRIINNPFLEPLATNLSLLLRFENETLRDYSGKNHNVFSSVTEVTSTGVFGNALIFNDERQLLINASRHLTLSSNFSVAFWYYPTTTVNGPIASRSNSFQILQTTSDINFQVYSGTFPTLSTVSVGTTAFQHLAFIYQHNGSHYTSTIYRNGAQFDQDTGTTTLYPQNGTGNLQIGTVDDTTYLDDFAMWNRALSADEVQALYRRGTT